MAIYRRRRGFGGLGAWRLESPDVYSNPDYPTWRFNSLLNIWIDYSGDVPVQSSTGPNGETTPQIDAYPTMDAALTSGDATAVLKAREEEQLQIYIQNMLSVPAELERLAASVPTFEQAWASQDPAYAIYWQTYGPWPAGGTDEQKARWLLFANAGGKLAAQQQDMIASNKRTELTESLIFAATSAMIGGMIGTWAAATGAPAYGPVAAAQDLYGQVTGAVSDFLSTGGDLIQVADVSDALEVASDVGYGIDSGPFEDAAGNLYNPDPASLPLDSAYANLIPSTGGGIDSGAYEDAAGNLYNPDPASLPPDSAYGNLITGGGGIDSGAYEDAAGNLYNPDPASLPPDSAYSDLINVSSPDAGGAEEIPRVTITAPRPDEIVWTSEGFVPTYIDGEGNVITGGVATGDVVKVLAPLAPPIIRAAWPPVRPGGALTTTGGGLETLATDDYLPPAQSAGSLFPWGLLIAAALALTGN